MAFVNLKPNVQGIVHSKASLVVHMEAMDQLKGLWVGKHIVPSGGGMCAMCSACVVTCLLSPLAGLCPNIYEKMVGQSLM